MDIQQWLAAIESPPRPEYLNVESSWRPKHPGSVTDARRRRKRSSSDSSLLKAPSSQPRRKGALATERDRSAARDDADTAQSNGLHSTHNESASSGIGSQHYARKPRHKVRLDRYEAAPKKAREHDRKPQSTQRSGQKKSKRKSKRRQDDKMGGTIGRNFHANNVSEGRLTLKPQGKLGLFGKGKISASIKGRGLPDLVFSEMKFLQRNHQSGLEPEAHGSMARKNRKDHTRRKEDDISAFFTSTRVTLADADDSLQAQSERHTTNASITGTHRQRKVRKRSAVPSIPIPSVELESKALHLESGNRSSCHESNGYVSWSESGRTPSATAGCFNGAQTAHRKRVNPAGREFEDVLDNGMATSRQRERFSMVHESMNATAERCTVSSVAPKPPGLVRSQSLAQQPSSPPQSKLVNRAVEVRLTQEVNPVLSTSPMLRVPDSVEPQYFHNADVAPSARLNVTSHTSVHGASMSKRNSADTTGGMRSRGGPQVSSSLDGVLQICNNLAQAEHRLAASRRDSHVEAQASPETLDTVQQSGRTVYHETSWTPTVRFLAAKSQPSALQNFAGPSFYTQQERHLAAPLDLVGGYDVQHSVIDGQDCGTGEVYSGGYEGLEEVDELSEEPWLSGRKEDVRGDMAGRDYVAEEVEEDWEARTGQVVGAGFWRPNKLY